MLGADPAGGGFEDADGVVEGRRRTGWSWPVYVVVGGFGADVDVDVVGLAAAGHPDVECSRSRPGRASRIPRSAVAPWAPSMVHAQP